MEQKLKVVRRKWRAKASLKLIGEIKQRTFIWNKKAPDHRDAGKLYEAWTEIAYELGVLVDEAKSHWKSLLSSFRKYKSLVIKSKRIGKEFAITPNWFAYQAMLFLTEGTDSIETKNTPYLARKAPNRSKVIESSITSMLDSKSARPLEATISYDASENLEVVTPPESAFYNETSPNSPSHYSSQNSPNSVIKEEMPEPLDTHFINTLSPNSNSSSLSDSNDVHNTLPVCGRYKTNLNLRRTSTAHHSKSIPKRVTRSQKSREQTQDSELTVSLKALLDATTQHMQQRSSVIAGDVARWIDSFDSELHQLVIGKLYLAMHSIEGEIQQKMQEDVLDPLIKYDPC